VGTTCARSGSCQRELTRDGRGAWRGQNMRQAIAIGILSFVAPLVCFLATQTAWSQIPPSTLPSGAAPAIDEVTVIAPRPPTASELAGENVKIFVKSHSKPKDTAAGALARWKYAICIKTEGLPSEFDDYVSARVEAIAAAVKMPPQTRIPAGQMSLFVSPTSLKNLSTT
jgi:hypothetical protein